MKRLFFISALFIALGTSLNVNASQCLEGHADCRSTDSKAYCKGYMRSTCLGEANKKKSARQCMKRCKKVESKSFCKGYCRK